MSTRKPSQPEAARESLATLMDSVVKLAMFCGLSEDVLHAEVARCCASFDANESEGKYDGALQAAHSAFFGALLGLWRSDPDYVDDTATPRALPASGPVSIEGLCLRLSAQYPKAAGSLNTDSVIKHLIDSKSIAENNDEYVMQAHYFRNVSTDAVFAMTQLSYAADYAHTAARNTFLPEDGWFQRVAHMPRFARNNVPFLKTALEEQGMQLLTAMDGILENGSVAAGAPDSESVHAGVGVYLYVKEDGKSRF